MRAIRSILGVCALCSIPQLAGATSSTFFGGAGEETVKDTLLWNGHYYVTGSTTSAQFDGTGTQAHRDAYVARIATDLSNVDVVTLGGNGNDVGVKIALHPNGQLIVFGETDDATGFTGEQLGVGGYEDIFVATLNADLTITGVALVGGDGLDYASGLSINIVPDHTNRGDIYIAGKSNSNNLPNLAGGAQEDRAGILDAYVMQLSADLTAVKQSSFLGGAHGSESYVTVCVAPNAKVYLYGVTNSDDFPTTDGSGGTSVALQQTEGGETDLFLTLLDPDLTAIEASTYLGGDGIEEGSGNIDLMFDMESEAIYVVAESRSTNFPVAGLDSRLRGFVAHIEADLSAIINATYIDGSSEFIDAAFHPTTGELYIIGSAGSSLEGTAGGAQEISGGGTGETFIGRYTHDLSTLDQTTFLGGNNHEFPTALEFNADATEVIAIGYTESTDFPGVANAVQDSRAGGRDAFVARFSADLTSMPQATYLGGSQTENIKGVAFDPVSEKILVVGETESFNFPFTEGTAQTILGGDQDGFVTLLSPTLASGAVADLSLDKSAPQGVAVDETLTYTLEVHNAGPDDASDVMVMDVIPAGLAIESVDPAATCIVVDAVVSCELGALASDATAVVTIVTTAPNIDTFIDNTATVSASSADPNLDNNQSVASTVVGDPQVDDPPVSPPNNNSGAGMPDRCDCRSGSPSPLWLGLGLVFAWSRRRSR